MGHEITLIATAVDAVPEDGVRLIPIKPRKGVRRRIFSSIDALRYSLACDAEILQIHDPDLLPWFLLAVWRGRRVVYDVHENFAERIESRPLPGVVRRLMANGFKRFERFAASKFAGLVTVTETMAESFESDSRPTVVVGNVPDVGRLPDLNLELPKFLRPTVFTSGTNSDTRNCRQTVRALRLIRRRVPEVQMMFVGRYVPAGYEQTLQELASELGCESNLQIEDMVPWSENFQRTARAHVGCVFYADNSNNRVTLPNRLFEYMLCGLPVLGEDFPEVRRVIEEAGCGLLVDSRRPESVSEAAVFLLTHAEEASQMGLRGRTAVLERLNFEVEARNLESLCWGILQSRGPGN